MKTLRLFLVRGLIAVLFSFGTSFAGQVTWGNVEDNNGAGENGLADAFGVRLLPGSLLLLGAFNISDSVIQANATNVPFLLSHFAQYGSTTIGGGDLMGTPGLFFQNTIGNPDTTTPFPVAGSRIYIWAFNSPTTTTATQQGIFSQATLSNWLFPHENDIPNTTSVDLSNLTNANGTALAAGADVVLGSFGQSALNPRDFELALIPEPSTYALILLGGAGLLFVRRRAQASRR